MKKLTLSFLFCLAICAASTAQVYVQTYDEYGGAKGKAININELDVEFCKISLSTWRKKKCELVIDYGQEAVISNHKSRASNSEGKLLKFNSLIDAMNHLHRNGWDYLESIVAISEYSSENYVLFKKRH